jgi:CheY-like chemotaxis protein
VLIVEDDPFGREALAQLLRGRGYPVITAADGREALERLRQPPPPGLILLDLKMPAMDGWEFCLRRNRDPRLACIPVVVVSAGAELPAAKAAALGVAGHLQKPVALDDLLDTVARWC